MERKVDRLVMALVVVVSIVIVTLTLLFALGVIMFFRIFLETRFGLSYDESLIPGMILGMLLVFGTSKALFKLARWVLRRPTVAAIDWWLKRQEERR